MSDSSLRLPARPSLEQLHKRAKELLRQYRAGDSAARERFGAAIGPIESLSPASLADAQFVIAREYEFETWAKLKHHIEALRPSGIAQYERLSREVAEAYSSGDVNSIREINSNYGTSFGWDHEPLDMQRRLATWFAAPTRTPDLALEDARRIVAHSYGFDSWTELSDSIARPAGDPRSASVFMSSAPPFYRIEWHDNRLSVRGPRTDKDWDTIVGVMKDHGITRLSGGGMTNAGMKRLSKLDQITHLHVEGSKELTDAGAGYLARMPQLRDLDMGGRTSPLTDRGLRALRHLPKLRQFKSCWTPGITDDGI